MKFSDDPECYLKRNGPFGFGIPRAKLKPKHYSATELLRVARQCHCGIKFYTLGELEWHYGIYPKWEEDPEVIRVTGSQEAHTLMHELAAQRAAQFKPVIDPSFKICVMTSDNRVIDEYTQVRAADTAPMSMFTKPILDWLRRTLNAGEAMQRDGRINGMPHLTKREGLKADAYKLRKELWQMTHNVHEPKDAHHAQLWAKIEQLCELAEGKQ